ncbi:MAG: cytochrome c3 family protein [Candidatus Binatia bacterium]
MKKWLPALVLLLLLSSAVGMGLSLSSDATSPTQPIAFSHKIHAGDNKIPCQYCHVNARRSSVAGIPTVARCMGCHKITAAKKPEIKKLKGYWDKKAAIVWSKVTRVPDFVFFEHWPHVRAGLHCQTCHGQVESMEKVRQAKELSMSECVTCHRQKKASIDCLTCHR